MSDKAPDKASPVLHFQVKGNLVYNRKGLELTLRAGDYVQFTEAQFKKLPASVSEHLVALAEVKITKPLG